MLDLRVANYLTSGGYTSRPLSNAQKFYIYLLRQAPYTADELAHLTFQPLAEIEADLIWLRSHGLVRRVLEVVPDVFRPERLFHLAERSARYGRRSAHRGRLNAAA